MSEDEEWVLVCCRVEHLTLAEWILSKLLPCSPCGQMVSLSPSGQQLRSEKQASIICMECTPDDVEFRIDPRTLDEVSRRLGQPFGMGKAFYLLAQWRREKRRKKRR